MIKVAVVEDNEKDFSALKECITRFGEEENIAFSVEWFKNGVIFLENRNANYDIVFMDIEMDHMNGIQTSEKLRETDEICCLIFITNMAQYAIDGYGVGALDYILKPVSYGSLKFRLQRALNTLKKRDDDIVIGKRQCVRISASDIVYVESFGHRQTYHTKNGNYDVFSSLSSIRKTLECFGFALCNSCYLVNLFYVDKIDGDYVFIKGEQLKISDNKKKSFKKEFINYVSQRGKL